MDFVKALDIAQGVFDKYKVDQRKWWNRMDGTPILNDVAVRMAQAFIAEQDLPSAALSAEPVHPSLPSPPVSGEAVKLQCDQVYEVNADTWYTAETLNKLLRNARRFIIEQDLFDAYCAWMQANDPLTDSRASITGEKG